MLGRHRGKILIASATAAVLVGAFVAVSANGESAQTLSQAQSTVAPESAPVAEAQSQMVPTAATMEQRAAARKAEAKRRVVQNAPAPYHPPLILGIRN
jgi:hypothetical protein